MSRTIQLLWDLQFQKSLLLLFLLPYGDAICNGLKIYVNGNTLIVPN